MGGLDLFILIVVGGLGVRSLLRGFVKEVFSLVGLVGAIIFARLFHETAAAAFIARGHSPIVSSVLGYGVIFIGITVVAAVVSWVMTRIVQKTALGPVNRIGGFAVGALQGLLIVGALLLIVTALAGSLENSFAKNSIFAPGVLGFVRFLSGIVFSTPAK